jgi:hypothetical protein
LAESDGIDLGLEQVDPTAALLAARKTKPKATKASKPGPIDLEIDELDETAMLLRRRAQAPEPAPDLDPTPVEEAPVPETAAELMAPNANWPIILHEALTRAEDLLRRRIQETNSPAPKPWHGQSAPKYVSYSAVKQSGSGDMFAIGEEPAALDRALTFLDRHGIAPPWPSLREACGSMAIVWAYLTPAALQKRRPDLALAVAQRLAPGQTGTPTMDACSGLLGDYDRWLNSRIPGLHARAKNAIACLHPDPLLRGPYTPMRSRGRLYVPLQEAAHGAHRIYNDAAARSNDNPWHTLRDAVRLMADAWWEATYREALANYPEAFWNELPQDVRDILIPHRPRPNQT